MKFSEKLRQLRIKNEYSQEEFAKVLNVSRQAVTKWENGKGMPDINNLRTIANLFDVTLDSLLDDAELIETTDEGFCFKISFAMAIIFFVVGWLLYNLMLNVNIGGFALGGGIIGYALGYIILQIKKESDKK